MTRIGSVGSSLLVGVLLVCTLAGCPNAVRPGAGVNGPPAARVGASGAGATLSVAPSPARQLVPSTFTVSLHPDPGPGATLTLTLTMPSMAMPATRLLLQPRGQGQYRGTGAFTMSGHWKAEISITVNGRQTTQVQSVDVR